MFNLIKKSSVLISIIILGIICLFIMVLKSLHEYKNKDLWVEHTYKVVIETNNLFSFLQDAETGQRGYLLTEKEEYLEPYTQGLKNSKESFENLKKLTSDNPIQQKRLDQLKKFVDLKFYELKETIDLTSSDKKREALKIVLNDSGKKYMDEIRTLINEFKKEEYNLLKIRSDESNMVFLTNQYLMFGAFIFLIVLIITIYKIIINKKQLKIENRNQKIQLLEQSKMASMGEMIGNIAHQWRQPLNSISITASSLSLQNKMQVLTSKDIDKYSDVIIKTTQHLSKTIEIFRGFTKENTEIKKGTEIKKEIAEALFIVDNSLNNNYIKLYDDINYREAVFINLVEGQLTQVLINILNNAKDILVERKIDKPWINLDLVKKDDKFIISIEDNAGGIEEEILPKVFEAYFTTKHQSQGTGLGLNLSYQIVTKLFGGKIYVKNTEFGAKFFVEIPSC